MCSWQNKFRLSDDMQRELSSCFTATESRQLIDILNEFFERGNASIFNLNNRQMRFFQHVVMWNRKKEMEVGNE